MSVGDIEMLDSAEALGCLWMTRRDAASEREELSAGGRRV